ncbi:MAG: bifunctional metallophosphatase/5'-nucleotidase, partial [Vulcanimicrobiota bacterium]
SVAGIIKEEKAKQKNTLLLDAGDVSAGSPVSDHFKAIPMIEGMNQLGYDAMTLGNHDIDRGSESIKNLVNNADFPVLAANMKENVPDSQRTGALPYIMKEIDGVKVGILGLTNSKIASMFLRKEDQKALEFANAVDTARKTIPHMKKDGADLVVMLSHLGLKEDRELASQVEGIGVIVGGHSHDTMEKPDVVNGTIITQAGSHGNKLGRLDLELEVKPGSARIKKSNFRLISTDIKHTKPDPQIEKIVGKYTRQLEPILNQKVGKSRVDLTKRSHYDYKEESNLGNFICDEIREYTDSDICMIPPGAIHGGIPAGDITRGKISQLHPFDSKISKMEMKGKDIREVLEQSLGGFCRSFMISGLRVEIDSSRPSGQQVLDIKMADGTSFDPEKTYTLATQDTAADGRMGLAAFSRGLNRRDTENNIVDILTEQIGKKDEISARKDGRIINRGLSMA